MLLAIDCDRSISPGGHHGAQPNWHHWCPSNELRPKWRRESMGSRRACDAAIYAVQSVQFRLGTKGRRGTAGGVSQYCLESVDVGSLPIKQQRYSIFPANNRKLQRFTRIHKRDLCVGSGCQTSHVVLVQWLTVLWHLIFVAWLSRRAKQSARTFRQKSKTILWSLAKLTNLLNAQQPQPLDTVPLGHIWLLFPRQTESDSSLVCKETKAQRLNLRASQVCCHGVWHTQLETMLSSKFGSSHSSSSFPVQAIMSNFVCIILAALHERIKIMRKARQGSFHWQWHRPMMLCSFGVVPLMQTVYLAKLHWPMMLRTRSNH